MKLENHEILAAFALYSEKLPYDEQKLAKGLSAAVEKAPSVGLGRFVDETGQLTEAAQISLQILQKEGKLAIEDDSFTIPPKMADKLRSSIRIFFSGPEIEELKQAAEAADTVWSTK